MALIKDTLPKEELPAIAPQLVARLCMCMGEDAHFAVSMLSMQLLQFPRLFNELVSPHGVIGASQLSKLLDGLGGLSRSHWNDENKATAMALWTQLKRAQRNKPGAAGDGDGGGDEAAAGGEDEDGDDGDWVEKKTPGGATYLYNTVTGDTKVPEDDEEEDEDDDDGDWVEKTTPGGKQYLYNTATGETKVPGEDEEEDGGSDEDE
jgi:hypothetical protein